MTNQASYNKHKFSFIVDYISFHSTFTENCGGVISLTGNEVKEITSPNYPYNYENEAICTWLIEVSILYIFF